MVSRVPVPEKASANVENRVDNENSKYYPRPKTYSIMSEDELVTKNFLEIVQQKLDNGLLRVPRGSHERKMLEEGVVYPGFYAGAIVAMAQFYVMRRTPSYLMKRHLQKSAKKGIDTISSSQGYKESNWFKPFSILIDGMLSSVSGLAVWMMFMDKKKVYQTAADIPLMKGRSNISDGLCNDFIEEFNRIRPDFWNEYKDDSLTALHTFVQNCRKRQAYEKILKKEMLVSDLSTNISLPNKVPDDILVTEHKGKDFDWASIEDFEEDETFP